MAKFSALHPYEILEDGLQLSHNGDISYTYELKLPPVYSMQDNDFESLIDLWTRALSMMPAGYVIQKTDWFYLAKYSRSEAKGSSELLAISTDMMFYNRPFLNHKCFLTITKTYHPDNQNGISIFNRNGNVPAVLKDRKYTYLRVFLLKRKKMEKVKKNSKSLKWLIFLSKTAFGTNYMQTRKKSENKKELHLHVTP